MVHNARTGYLVVVASVLLISTLPLVVSQGNCVTDEDCFVNPMYGQFSECIDLTCHCLDYFVLSPEDNGCINVVPSGKSCTYHDQCRGSMGDLGRCNRTTGVCDCEQLTDVEIVISEGRCTQVKKAGETCSDDKQCIVGSNEFARCNKDPAAEIGTCGCLENEIVKFVVDKDSQLCVLDECRCDPSCVNKSKSNQ